MYKPGKITLGQTRYTVTCMGCLKHLDVWVKPEEEVHTRFESKNWTSIRRNWYCPECTEAVYAYLKSLEEGSND